MRKSISTNELLSLENETLIRYMPPLIEQRKLGMVHAWRGTGKTHFAIALSLAAASGGRYLKWGCHQPARVLYIDSEMTTALIRPLITKMIASSECDFASDALRFACSDLFETNKIPDIATPFGATWLMKEAEDRDLIVIDNLSGVTSMTKDNDEHVWNLIEPTLMKLRGQNKCVILIHHSNKAGTQTGTSKKESPLDWVISLRRPADYSNEQGARFEVIFEKARGIFGSEAEDISAWLREDLTGKQYWQWEAKEASTEDMVKRMHYSGMTPMQISKDLCMPLFRAKQMVRKLKDDVPTLTSKQLKEEISDDTPF